MSTETSVPIKLRLRYWNCRGRVQAVRYMLEDIAYNNSHLDYQEEPELFEKAAESWFQHKFDETIAGPFHNLPVLHWNDREIFGQTLSLGLSPILFSFIKSILLALAQLLARKFHLYGQLTSSITDEDFLRTYLDGIVSCAYTDIITNVLTCIWMMVDFVDENNPMNRLTKKIPGDLKTLNSLLEKSSTVFYYDQLEPTIADYFVLEALTAARDYSVRLLPEKDDRQALEKLEQTMRERPALANYYQKGLLYKRFSGSPKESEYIAKLAENIGIN